MFGIGNVADGDSIWPGVVVGDHVSSLRPELGAGATMEDVWADWPRALKAARHLADGVPDRGVLMSSVRPLPPVPPTCQVLCAGANYYRHTAEMTFLRARHAPAETRIDEQLWAESGVTGRRLAESGRPYLFAGVSSALSGAQDDVILWGPGAQHDWEIELGVLIGQEGRDMPTERAAELIAGYVVVNDVTTRDLIARTDLPLTDFLAAKSRPTWLPTGPYVVPAEFVPDPRALQLQLRVNGELMQDSRADDMIFDVPQLVAYASSTVTLRPGDLLLTGSPAGNAAIHGNRWLQPGDVVESEITGLGRQRTVCVAPAAAAGGAS